MALALYYVIIDFCVQLITPEEDDNVILLYETLVAVFRSLLKEQVRKY
jgi:hypothetical protein